MKFRPANALRDHSSRGLAKFHAEFRAEAFNVLNHTVLGTPSTAVNAPRNASGTITSTANSPRILQFALKLIF